MAGPINWIHLTDLHLGLDDRGWLWPRLKRVFFDDLKEVIDEVGPIDLVFFTGDLVQSGDAKEYQHLENELAELWNVFARNGSTPSLCVVPGNHDLVRPAPQSLFVKTMTGIWSTDADLRKQFWREPDCETRIEVNSSFTNFVEWQARSAIPHLRSTRGQLPGDFSATFERGTASLGIIGLNSTFLQVSAGDFKRKLELHISQLNSVCEGDPTRWVLGKTASVLLTHHPPTWLSDEALRRSRDEMYPPGRFIAHFYGHQHEPEAFEVSEAGAAPRRYRQGPSLFGLEEWSGVSPQRRIHGYTVGQFILEEVSGIRKIVASHNLTGSAWWSEYRPKVLKFVQAQWQFWPGSVF